MEFRTTNINYNLNADDETESIVVSLTATSDNRAVYASATVTVKPEDITEGGTTLDDLSRKELSKVALDKFKKEVG
ncbi:hypothetical protein [Ligilactobacillus equi]